MSNNVLRVTGGQLEYAGKIYRCAVGKGGFSGHKKEGDGCTPLGTFALRECWYRADRLRAPLTQLPLNIITPNDGWCDAPASPDYNKHVKLPFAANHEKLFRDDPVYDIIVPLGYNDGPIVPGKGSAIFLHIAHEDYRDTEGCVALAREDLLAILKTCGTSTMMSVSGKA